MTRTTALATVVPKEMVTSLRGWERLQLKEQTLILAETEALFVARISEGFSKIEQGRHYQVVHDILEPRRMFLKYLDRLQESRKTAYRRMAMYKYASENMPENVLKAALARGLDFGGGTNTKERPLGEYTRVIKNLPPPKTEDPKIINAYLDKVEETRARNRRRGVADINLPDPRDLMQGVFRKFDSAFKALPQNGRVRTKWVNDFIGMQLTRLGVSNSRACEPVAIPADFVAKKGRPPKKAEAE